MLTPHLTRHADGELAYEGVRLADIARQFGTPTYVYSRATIVENFRAYQSAFAASKPLICYSVKANSTLSVLALLASEGAGFDIVSAGELQRVIAAGGDASKVIFSGVAKGREEIALALSHNIHCFNVESEVTTEGIAAITVSMPLPGDSSPNVMITSRPDRPSLAFIGAVSVKGRSGIPWAITTMCAGSAS